MTMKQKYVKWRRGRIIDQATANGIRINELKRARAGVDSSLWPSVADALDADIRTRERRQKRYLNYLKTTEAL